MIYNQGNGMVPLWSTGVDNLVNKIVGDGGFRPTMD